MREHQLTLRETSILDFACKELTAVADRAERDLKAQRLIVKQAAAQKLEAVALDDGLQPERTAGEPAVEQRLVFVERGVGDAELREAELAPETLDCARQFFELGSGRCCHRGVGSCLTASIIAPMSLPAEELPESIYSVADVRTLERLASEAGGVPSYDLMCRAGAAALAVLRRRWPRARSLAIVCGAGNNAGDGLVVARLAAAEGLDVRALSLVSGGKWRGDAARAAADCEAAGMRVSGVSAKDELCEMIELPGHPWFVGCQFHPEFTSTPRAGHPLGGHMWVPIDDENCWAWSFNYHPKRDLKESELNAMKDGKGIHVKYVPGSFIPLANARNDYLIDRAAQKAGVHYSGIEGIAIIGQAGKPGPVSGAMTITVDRDGKTIATRATRAAATIGARCKAGRPGHRWSVSRRRQ